MGLITTVQIFEQTCELVDEGISPEDIPKEMHERGLLPDPFDLIWSRQERFFSITEENSLVCKFGTDGLFW